MGLSVKVEGIDPGGAAPRGMITLGEPGEENSTPVDLSYSVWMLSVEYLEAGATRVLFYPTVLLPESIQNVRSPYRALITAIEEAAWY